MLTTGMFLVAPAHYAATADTGQPYKSIAERNVFNLHPPAPPPAPPPPPSPTSNVKLTGILTILAAKKAVLQIAEPGKAAESKILKEGEREGDVEVLEINEIDGTVRIKNRGEEATLNFQDHGVKPPSGAAPVTPTNIVMIGGRPVPIGPNGQPILTGFGGQPPITTLPTGAPAGTILPPGSVAGAYVPPPASSNLPAPMRIMRTP